MKKLLLLSLFSSFALATSYRVQIQCDTQGPVFDGTLEFELDPMAWKQSSCLNGPPSYTPNYSTTSFTPPTLSLSFNGVTYTSATQDAGFPFNLTVYFSQSGCNNSKKNLYYAFNRANQFTSGFGIELVNKSTGFQQLILFDYSFEPNSPQPASKLPGTFALPGHCFGRVM